ncbi:mixed lineage kinase domain-like protein [Chiloscyllium plagiosum]|uniref:mixed lineage kinase domain-like protein n=1 Tax=Chiloscyllium plagiosum TaxID=36176 RepID=UPI001CB7FE6E|nr:mixed lineage kinase domain-like protein [Chiloscyllium plagiosum]XP_043563176.1 mixed lineage kinase domain-like protein [Chiloscyllium plagiosum]
MDYIEKIFKLAQTVYSLCGEVKMNRKRCQRLKVRIECLMEIVADFRNHQDLIKPKIMKEMMGILEFAGDFIKSFTNKHGFSKVFKAYEIKEDFNHLNERINDVASAFVLALQTKEIILSNLVNTFDEKQRGKDDEQDTKDDEQDLEKTAKKLEEALHSMGEMLQQTVNDGVQEIKMDLKDIKRILDSYNEKFSAHPVKHISDLKIDDIEMENKPFMETDKFKYYKGMLYGFPVAIKRFLNVGFSNLNEIQKTFYNEAQTMKHYESPNIVRIYGICINQKDHEFLIVMEYCELGTLRSVLIGEQNLSWQTRVRMARDAASGLYRLHESYEKFKLHCSIDSTTFLVDHSLRVKLAGLQLAKTESSIRHISTSSQRSQQIAYISPQQLNDVNYKYDKPCEVYSFGIVLWEIASRKLPFKDCNADVIHQKVCDEKFREPLPSDCPKDLCELIDECRADDPFERPKAGVIVSRLKGILNRISGARNTSWD